MAFIKFLKKKDKKLDIPPPPPFLDIPPPPDDLELPELPPLPEDLPPLPEEKEEFVIPEPPKIEPIEEEPFKIKPKPVFKPTQKPKLKRIEEIKEEAVILKSKKYPSIGREMFVKADHYRQILEGTDTIKRKIRESEKILDRLNEIKNIKDKEFEKWRVLLEDIERKSIYIDKTLFER